MDAAPPVATYRFAGFVLDIRRGSLLTAAGEELSLRRQSFESLRLCRTDRPWWYCRFRT
jgi:hypothetical protein